MLELERTNNFLYNLHENPEYKIHRPITTLEHQVLSEKILKARILTGFKGEKIDFPENPEEDIEYPQGYSKELQVNINSNRSINFGINIFSERYNALDDVYLQYLTPKETLRFNLYIDGTFSLKVTGTYDENKMYYSRGKKLANMNDFEYGIFSELLDKFIILSAVNTHSEVK